MPATDLQPMLSDEVPPDAREVLGELLRDLALSAGRCSGCSSLLAPSRTFLAGHALVCDGCRRRLIPIMALRGITVVRVAVVQVPEVP